MELGWGQDGTRLVLHDFRIYYTLHWVCVITSERNWGTATKTESDANWGAAAKAANMLAHQNVSHPMELQYHSGPLRTGSSS